MAAKNSKGTIFASYPYFVLSPQLSMSMPKPSGPGKDIVLKWPTNAAGLTLQSTTNLSPAVWNTASPAPVAVSGQYTVTNAITGPQMFYKLALINPPGMAFIPAGTFTMGDMLDSETDSIPTNITLSAFYMDTDLVSYSQWQGVYYWATNHGYGFDNAGVGKSTNHPVYNVNWYDAVKWCNRAFTAGRADAGVLRRLELDRNLYQF